MPEVMIRPKFLLLRYTFYAIGPIEGSTAPKIIKNNHNQYRLSLGILLFKHEKGGHSINKEAQSSKYAPEVMHAAWRVA